MTKATHLGFILETLKDELGYELHYKVIDAQNFRSAGIANAFLSLDSENQPLSLGKTCKCFPKAALPLKRSFTQRMAAKNPKTPSLLAIWRRLTINTPLLQGFGSTCKVTLKKHRQSRQRIWFRPGRQRLGVSRTLFGQILQGRLGDTSQPRQAGNVPEGAYAQRVRQG